MRGQQEGTGGWRRKDIIEIGLDAQFFINRRASTRWSGSKVRLQWCTTLLYSIGSFCAAFNCPPDILNPHFSYLADRFHISRTERYINGRISRHYIGGKYCGSKKYALRLKRGGETGGRAFPNRKFVQREITGVTLSNALATGLRVRVALIIDNTPRMKSMCLQRVPPRQRGQLSGERRYSSFSSGESSEVNFHLSLNAKGVDSLRFPSTRPPACFFFPRYTLPSINALSDALRFTTRKKLNRFASIVNA